jgi:chorismate mutase
MRQGASLVCGVGLILFSLLASGQQAVNQNSVILADFSRRVTEYVKLRKAADAGIPASKQSNSPQEIAQREHSVAEKIQSARAQAKQGDIFSPQIADLFRQLIRQSLKAEQGKQIHQSLRHSEPVRGTAQVNRPYPRAVPLQSMPPTLLKNLPELPQSLDYRIINHDLILRDVEANLVIDIIPDAMPSQNVNAAQ